MRAARARVVYLVRATIAAPFGPDSSLPSAAKTEALRQADGVVAVSEYVAGYARQWGGLKRPRSHLAARARRGPLLGRFDNRFVMMVNPCAVKGISIFLALAERFPDAEFAAVPTWGTTARTSPRCAPPQHRGAAAGGRHPRSAETRVALVPSLWAEARSRMILEAMSRGIPVIASDVGGLAEAKLGVDYLLPVKPVVRYQPGG